MMTLIHTFSPRRTVLTVMVVAGLGLLLLAPMALAAESSLGVYGGSAQSLVDAKTGAGGAPLPSTGLAVFFLVASAAVTLGLGLGFRRLADRAG